jgi:hypothetical protein
MEMHNRHSSSSSAPQADSHDDEHNDEHDESVALMVNNSPTRDDHLLAEYNIKLQSWPEVRVLSSVNSSGVQVYKSAKRPKRVVRNMLIFGLRGAENFLVYLWIIKDLAWTQTWFNTSIAFGFLSVFVQFILLLQSVYERNFDDFWHNVATCAWLFSNFWAMTGEEYDETFGGNGLGDTRDLQSGYLMGATLCWLSLYHIVLYPFNLIPSSKSIIPTRYDEVGLKSRFLIFRYEIDLLFCLFFPSE